MQRAHTSVSKPPVRGVDGTQKSRRCRTSALTWPRRARRGGVIFYRRTCARRPFIFASHRRSLLPQKDAPPRRPERRASFPITPLVEGDAQRIEAPRPQQLIRCQIELVNELRSHPVARGITPSATT